MENTTHIKLELGISAQKLVSMIQVNNESIEDQIAKGIELAIKDLTDGDNFVQQIRDVTKKEVASLVNQAVMSWEVKNKISKVIAEKMEAKIEEYADSIASKMTEHLNNN